ncbi:SDR family oxidoreductase [Kushneria marisflavi]|uniref:Short-chain dehydrogenase n=1 Tax=Kushneria marisflavi TaxID=157779 RepID=A0A240UP75_9GAMM|nr:SDR family oxidoreductase [Kushneria marisflavi]ART63317.1 short-chain dehydrogenase [Kushneria marisflavi]RKD84355.1 short-subunit dehydrogenase [Kushneria marisflavi]
MPDGKQEVTVVTGAGAGLGCAIAHEFARHGSHVGLIGRDEGRLETVKKALEAMGVRAVVVSADVADADQVEAAAEQIEAALGPIDVWVNAAMTTLFSSLSDMSPEDYRRVTDVTYHGNVYGTMAALKRMRARNSGTIVQVGSALAYRAVPLQSAYCGAKHAIKGYTQALRTELLNEGSRVHVTMVEMPGLNTPQFDWCKSHLPHRARPVAPVYQPEVGARAVYWAAHHRRREIYVGRSAIMSIWGNKVFPGLLDRYLARTAVSGQQTDERRPPGRPDNLWQPVPGARGAHGRFDDEALSTSAQLWATTHRRELGLMAGALVIVGSLLKAGSRRSTRRLKRR